MRKAETYHLHMAIVKKSGTLTSWNPGGLIKPVMRQLYCIVILWDMRSVGDRNVVMGRVTVYVNVIYIYHHRYSALGPVWAETRAQSGDWYGSGMLHPGQVLRVSYIYIYLYTLRLHIYIHIYIYIYIHYVYIYTRTLTLLSNCVTSRRLWLSPGDTW